MLYCKMLTIAKQTRTANPNRVKYATKAGREKSISRSSREWVGSGTMPKIAMRTAPPAMKRVPRIIQRENTSPRMKQAKNAFHNKETAPRGARMTMGREAIWNTEPRMLEVINMTAEVGQTTVSGGAQRRTESKQPKPRSGRARSALILWVGQRDTHGRRCSTRWRSSGRAWLRI